jgi:tRNA-splicing ligase RtcB
MGSAWHERERQSFVEIGRLVVNDERLGLGQGEYLALLSHSGSRGTGAQIAQHYSCVARARHPELPKELSTWPGST